MQQLAEAFVEAARRGADPLLAQLGEFVIHEGHTLRHHDQDGRDYDVTPQEYRASVAVSDDECSTLWFAEVVVRLTQIGRDIGDQQGHALIHEAIRSATEGGARVDAQGRPFDPQMLVDVMDAMDIRFDDGGNPIMPMILVPPGLAEYLMDNGPEWEADTEWRARLDEVTDRKRDEWRAREAARRLVD